MAQTPEERMAASNEAAQERIRELVARRAAGDTTFDNFKQVLNDPSDITQGVHVEARRHDDHTVWERQ